MDILSEIIVVPESNNKKKKDKIISLLYETKA